MTAETGHARVADVQTEVCEDFRCVWYYSNFVRTEGRNLSLGGRISEEKIKKGGRMVSKSSCESHWVDFWTQEPTSMCSLHLTFHWLTSTDLFDILRPAWAIMARIQGVDIRDNIMRDVGWVLMEGQEEKKKSVIVTKAFARNWLYSSHFTNI